MQYLAALSMTMHGLTLLFQLIVLTGVGSLVHMTSSGEPQTLQAARLELLVLTAMLPDVADTVAERYLSAGKVSMSASEMARHLQRIAKPVVCSSASTPEGEVFVDCKALKSGDDSILHNFESSRGEQILQLADDAAASSGRGGLILVRGHVNSMLVTHEVFEEWYRNYATRGLTFITHGPADDDLDQQVGYVVSIHPISAIDRSALPPS